MEALSVRSGGEELRALLLLDQLPGVGPARLGAIVRAFGTARSALEAPEASFRSVAGEPAARARASRQVARTVDRALASAAELGVRVVSWADAIYPSGLRQLADPPPVLFLAGHTRLIGASGVTIVGSRRATARSRGFTERLAARLAGQNVAVVSGMALGIDGAAHRGALAAGGPTIAVLGTGIDVPYPRAHLRLLDRVRREGLIVSEFLPGTPALPHRFPRRNRILAALGAATVVVEAGARSGSLITVDHALDLGRDVWAVPGPIEHSASFGSNRLLVEGARPLLSIEHFMGELLGRDRGGQPVDEKPSAVPRGSSNVAPSSAARVLAQLDRPSTGDEVASRLGLPVRDVLLILTELEMAGIVRRLADLRFGRAA